jgi:hypothetical protein
MKNKNPKSTQWLNHWRCGDSTASKNLFLICLCIWFVLLLCRLLQKELGEFVSVMECNPNYSMKTFVSCVNQGFARRLARRLLGNEGMRMGGGYLMPVEEYKHEAFCDRGS